MSAGPWKNKTFYPCPHCDSSFSKRVKLRDHLMENYGYSKEKAEDMASKVKRGKKAKAAWC